jgi:hypothetical protein
VPAPIPQSHAWLDNEFDVWDDLEDRPLADIPEAELDWARVYLRGIRERRISLMMPRTPGKNFMDHKVFQFLENVWMKATRERRNPVWRPFLWARQYVSKVRRERGERRLYRDPDLGVPYVFFPLQKPGDIQLTVRAQQYSLEEVALKLTQVVPPGWRVVIKGHPTWVGTYPVEMYERLLARGNVDIVPAGYDVLKLIQHARAVVTVNNTVGYEAVLLKKPVVTMTPTYYSRYGRVASSLENLGDALRAALEAGFPYPESEIERFVANLRAATHVGKTHFILNKKNEVLTRRDIARTLSDYRQDAADHAQSILAKLERVRTRTRAAPTRMHARTSSP